MVHSKTPNSKLEICQFSQFTAILQCIILSIPSEPMDMYGLPLEPMDMHGLKMYFALSASLIHKTGTQNHHAWPDRCIIHSGGIIPVAVMAFKQLVKAKMESEMSDME